MRGLVCDHVHKLTGTGDDTSGQSDRRLFARYRRFGDLTARETLIGRYSPLARGLAHRYRRGSEPLDDLIQVALLGLIKAVDRYEVKKSPSFPNYATPTILGELKRHFRDKAWAVNVPRELQELALKVDKTTTTLSEELGRTPTVKEIGDDLGATMDKVLEAIAAADSYVAASLDATHSSREDELPLVERLGSDETSYELVEQAVTIAPALQRLPERERLILHLRFAEDMTQAEIAERVGVSQMHVSRLMRRALERLRELTE